MDPRMRWTCRLCTKTLTRYSVIKVNPAQDGAMIPRRLYKLLAIDVA